MRSFGQPSTLGCLVTDGVANGSGSLTPGLSAGAACFNLCLAANALGYGTSWITEWIAYNKAVGAALGLGENERIAGFVYVGTPAEPSDERERPALSDIVSRWPG